ncbi:hypothetical protein R1sor_023120 [Riccia sorocarpa]|uniref:C2H2-type domain-containing protein n=1 Tax=Riccia sorocarpa TaxID=122646 RepID=A0ABD3GSR2_9MARC
MNSADIGKLDSHSPARHGRRALVVMKTIGAQGGKEGSLKGERPSRRAMNAERGRKTVEDQATVKLGYEARTTGGFEDVNGKWKVSQQSTVSAGITSLQQEVESISTSDYLYTMNGSIGSSAPQLNFQGVVEEVHLKKEASEDHGEPGVLDRYVMDCSPVREGLVDNGAVCLQNESLEALEDADNEFGSKRVERNGGAEFQREGEYYEESHPSEVGFKAMHFQQLLADSEAEDDCNILGYSGVDQLPLGEEEEEAFSGQGCHGAARETLSHESIELDQRMQYNQVLDTSDYTVEADEGVDRNHFNGSSIEALEGGHQVTDPVNCDRISLIPGSLICACPECSLISNEGIRMVCRATPQVIVPAAGAAAQQVTSPPGSGDGAGEHATVVAQALDGLRNTNETLAADSAYRPAGDGAMYYYTKRSTGESGSVHYVPQEGSGKQELVTDARLGFSDIEHQPNSDRSTYQELTYGVSSKGILKDGASGEIQNAESYTAGKEPDAENIYERSLAGGGSYSRDVINQQVSKSSQTLMKAEKQVGSPVSGAAQGKVEREEIDPRVTQAGGNHDVSGIKGESSADVSDMQQNKGLSESGDSPGSYKGREDVKPKSGQRETIGIPLWVKWRGKWQPGIQCSSADCPPATLKAKPSYSKKHYIVVYSPIARNYSWVDSQHTCPITDKPYPLFSGTHEAGRETVKDVFITRRRMLLKLGGEMLDISDRLHVKAVVEVARNVNVWKNFAKEAAAATTYAQLGSLLVNLHLAIVRDFIKPGWMMKRHPVWKEECVRAESAAAVQKLTKELINAVLWEDVGPLWNEPDQPELDPQWSNWKGDAFEEKEDPTIEAYANLVVPSEKHGGQVQIVSAGGPKRFKEQARARRQRPQSPEVSDGTPLKRSKHNPVDGSEGEAAIGRAITAFRSPLVHPSRPVDNQHPLVPVLEADRCHEVISMASLSVQRVPNKMDASPAPLELHNKTEASAPSVNVSSKTEAVAQSMSSRDTSLLLASSSGGYYSEESDGDESKVFEKIGKHANSTMGEGLIALESGLCSAFLQSKGRRCHRLAKKAGVKYCEKHLYLVDPAYAGKRHSSEGNAWPSGLCSAFLRRENRRCARQSKEGFQGYCGFHVHLASNDSDRNGEMADAAAKGENGNFTSANIKDDRCQGITTRGVQCTHRTKDGSSYCVKHLVKCASQAAERELELKRGELEAKRLELESIAREQESKGQSSGASKMDWQKVVEPAVSLAPSEQAEQPEASHHNNGSESGPQEEGIVRTLELKSFDSNYNYTYNRGSEGSTRKRKALSSFFTDSAVVDPRPSAATSQEAPSPKFAEVKPATPQWNQCKGRTMRNEEQCSFRAKEGEEYCLKHMNAMEAKRKLIVQRSLRIEEVSTNDSNAVEAVRASGAKSLLNRFIRGVERICTQSSGSDAANQLVQSFKLDAARDGTAEELVKLVTVEMTKLQRFLHPLNGGEEAKKEVDTAAEACTSSGSLPPPSEAPENRGEPSVRSVPRADGHRHYQVDKKTVTCGLCDSVEPGVSDLGRHWQQAHKKDVGLFVKGHACRVCDRLYTRKQTVMTHWKKRHESIAMVNPDLSVCFACDVRYADDDFLLEHVIVMHPYQLSNPALKEMVAENRAIIGAEHEGGSITLKCPDCPEEFDTQFALHQHREKVHRRPDSVVGNNSVSVTNRPIQSRLDVKSGESIEAPPQNGKYVCRLCGSTFPLLPDLGRHHQAAHMLGKKEGAGPRSAVREKEVEKEVASECGRMKLPIRRKGDEKAGIGSSYGPIRKKKKKLRFTSHKKAYEKDTRGPNALRFHVQAVLQGASLRKRHRKLSDGLACGPSGKDPSSSLTQSDFNLPRENQSDNNSKQSKEGLGAGSGSGSLSLTRRVESNLDSVQEKFKVQADKILTNFSQLHGGETSIKHEVQRAEDFRKSWNIRKGLIKQDHDPEASQDVKLERPKLPLNSCNDAERRKPNFVVTCEDLSAGQEPVPIVCVIDQDILAHLRSLSNKDLSGVKDVYQPSSFTYITKRRLDPSLGLVPENYKIGCSCDKAQCTPDACEHVNLFDCDNAEACDIYGNPMRGRFPYDDHGCIILEEGYLVYECNSSCHCHEACHNRVLQKGVNVKLEVFKTQHKGWAVRAAQQIPRGTFVCEYVGEVLRDQDANKRGERYDQVGCSYLYDIDAHIDISGRGRRCKPFVIDATSQGNVARFINHSCAPNLVNYQVLVESMDAQLAHIGLFASRDIEIGEELAYDYRYRLLPGKGCPCHCGAKNCRGRLY